jgi:hypothetical protein
MWEMIETVTRDLFVSSGHDEARERLRQLNNEKLLTANKLKVSLSLSLSLSFYVFVCAFVYEYLRLCLLRDEFTGKSVSELPQIHPHLSRDCAYVPLWTRPYSSAA